MADRARWQRRCSFRRLGARRVVCGLRMLLALRCPTLDAGRLVPGAGRPSLRSWSGAVLWRGGEWEMVLQQHEVEVFARLCVGRRDTYAVQREDGRYVRVGERVTYARLWEHLAGRLTLGTYVIDEQGMCRFAVFDDDRADGLARLAEVQARLRGDRVPSSLEVSRRGGHLWVWLACPVRASEVRWWLRPYVLPGVEFYPRQDESDGLGSLMRLPLGVHRLTGQRYPLVAWRDGGAVALASSVAGMV